MPLQRDRLLLAPQPVLGPKRVEEDDDGALDVQGLEAALEEGREGERLLRDEAEARGVERGLGRVGELGLAPAPGEEGAVQAEKAVVDS